jgi:hypothetical protein
MRLKAEILLGSALLVLSSAAQADWSKLYGDDKGEFFVDPASIFVKGSFRQAWYLTTYKQAICVGDQCYQSMKQLTQVDCENRTTQTLYVSFIEKQMGIGQEIHAIEEPSSVRPIPPGTMEAANFKALCKPQASR